MKKTFTVKEKLYAMHEITIEAENEEAIDEILDSTNDSYNIDDYVNALKHNDGVISIKYEEGDVEQDDECEFWNWQ